MPTTTSATARRAALWGAIALGVSGFLAAAPASAASFRCSAHVSVNDAGPGSDTTTSTPCGVQYGVPEGNAASAGTSADLGLLRGGTHALSTTHQFVGSSTYADVFDQVVVSGLGDQGATLNFRVSVDGFLNANGSAPTQFYATTAAADFAAQVFLSTTSGRGANDTVNGCVRNVQSGISTCNGVFDYGVSTSETVQSIMPLSIFVVNGDVMNIVMALRTSALAWGPDGAQSAEASSNFGHTMYWDGLVFDDASRNVVLTSNSGFDYRLSALPAPGGVPEPTAWALMITGFGLTGAMLRLRRAAIA